MDEKIKTFTEQLIEDETLNEGVEQMCWSNTEKILKILISMEQDIEFLKSRV